MDVLTQYIKKEYSFINNNLLRVQDGYFNIAYGTDANYQMGAAISIASILENNKKENEIIVSMFLLILYQKNTLGA
ncbi:hypothetical protein PXV97_00790 [Citrobacter freundii]|nr:hypothetical protein PXV97_00790 [Citrobacter freundii]